MTGNLWIRTLLGRECVLWSALQVLRFLDPVKDTESLNYTLGTFLSNVLAGVATYACFMLYLLKVPAVELIKAQQRFSLATIHLF